MRTDTEERLSVFGRGQEEAPVPLSPLWHVLLCSIFIAGGLSFISGTGCFFFKTWHDASEAASILFIIGSSSFLIVDMMEMITSPNTFWVRLNLAMNTMGSIFYVVGSIGFIPAVFNEGKALGALGFIVGSILIGYSQIWKIIRTGTENSKFKVSTLFADGMWVITSVDVSICIGACSFFIGSVMFISGPLEGPWYESVLFIWMIGSIYYTIGALFLCYASYQLIYGIQDDKNSDDSWDRVK